MNSRILIVEDEPDLAMVLHAYLRQAGYATERAETGERALELTAQWRPQLVLLDVLLPDLDGWVVLERLRAHSSIPVIMLTALGDLAYKLQGFERGADDYITKPFIGEELVARVGAVLRRPARIMTPERAVFGGLSLDFGAREVSLRGRQVPLPPRDLELLTHMARHPNYSLSRAQLIEAVWGIDYDGSDRAVDMAVTRIRQALAEWPAAEGEIATIRNYGYQFRVAR
ncbi:response regulator transcription factor [Paenibacillus sp. IB182496]|uniref:Response regulator transcription factor n=1 Tax=Paenibacillus sabuli TaxID=2772509 RepID=A0A927GQ88_9BACL|nr:response regulator transcription factor [Paenibacillus sabuli]MBD2843630.1 response regulator transcription factor [Paenibacillus sabuli]